MVKKHNPGLPNAGRLAPGIKLLLVLSLLLLLTFTAIGSDDRLDSVVDSLRENIVNISLAGAFIGGMLTLLAPCVFPLIAAYLVFLTGRKHIVQDSIAFFLGFGIPFIALITASTWIGQFVMTHRITVSLISGAAIILFGIMAILGKGFSSPIPVKARGSAFVLGLVFGVSWSPCVGPILFAIIFLTANAAGQVYSWLLGVGYLLGMALPFLLMSVYIQRRGELHMPWLTKEVQLSESWRASRIQIISGTFLMLLGALVGLTGGTDLINLDVLRVWSGNYVLQGMLLEITPKLLSGTILVVSLILLALLVSRDRRIRQ